MSFKANIASPDLAKQIELLQYYPEIASKHMYPAMKRATEHVRGKIEPEIPVLTGRAKSAFRSTVTGKGFNIIGQVGWYGKGQPWYMNVLEYGAKPHEESYVPSLGVSFLKVVHPGVQARHFMEKGFRSSYQAIQVEIQAAGDEIVRELAVP